MKFLPTVDLWDPSTVQAIHAGELRLQTGQWVRCGNGPLSRFVEYRHDTRYFNVVHSNNGRNAAPLAAFRSRCEQRRIDIEFRRQMQNWKSE